LRFVPPTFYQELGTRIARFRQECGLTQVQLAESLGVSQQTITSVEKGRRRVSVSQLLPLSKALGLSVEALLGQQKAAKKRGPTPKLIRQMELISQLPKAKQRFVMEMLDAVLKRAS